VIDGINDEAGNKMILYGAKTVREFKDKLKIYERIKKNQPEKATKHARSRDESIKYAGRKPSREDVKRKTTDNYNQEDEIRKHCFYCGASGHYAKKCDKKSLGKKCFVCNKFGHEMRNYSEKRVLAVTEKETWKIPYILTRKEI